MEDVYKAACNLIGRTMRDWALDVQGGNEFTHFVQGVLALVDEIVERGAKTGDEDDSDDC